MSATTARLQRKALKPTSTGEILRFFGILVLITRLEFSERRTLWGGRHGSKRVQQVDLARDMSRHRFEEILSYISFSAIVLPPADDRWAEVEGFAKAITAHRHAVVTPGETLCVDESISRWYGLGGDWSQIGLPHYVKLDRKPESGCEMKTACCGSSGIMLSVELTKSATETETRDFEHDNQHGTATILRLVEPWFNSDRHVCADSWFASVLTTVKLWDVGMRFTGVVKTATRLYPLPYLSSLEMQRKGDFVSMTSGSSQNRPSLLAVCWADRDRRYFVSSAGTTNMGTPIYRERYRTVNGRASKQAFEIPIPQVCEDYYKVCSQIDRHNRCRQDDLNLEKKFRTLSWSTRVNTSLLAIVIVDAWLLYKNSRGGQFCKSPWTFYNELADGLLDNTHDSGAMRHQAEREAPSPAKRCAGTGISLVPTTRKRRRLDGTLTNISYQARCVVCGKKSRHFCSECHSTTGKETFVCYVDRRPECFDNHLHEKHGRSSM